jgi:hypothetical protein
MLETTITREQKLEMLKSKKGRVIMGILRKYARCYNNFLKSDKGYEERAVETDTQVFDFINMNVLNESKRQRFREYYVSLKNKNYN